MDQYDGWRECLRTGSLAGNDTPMPGFWRRKFRRGGRYQPVAVFERDGELVCVVGESEERPIHHVWSVFLEPISEDVYRVAALLGYFADELETHQFAKAECGPLTTDLRDARSVLPILKGNDDEPTGSRSE